MPSHTPGTAVHTWVKNFSQNTFYVSLHHFVFFLYHYLGKHPKFCQARIGNQNNKHCSSISVVTPVCWFATVSLKGHTQSVHSQKLKIHDFLLIGKLITREIQSHINTDYCAIQLQYLHKWGLLNFLVLGSGLCESTDISVLPVCAWVWPCCSCRLWLSTDIPLSLCSFSPSGDGVWFWLAVQLLAPCLFCLQLFHLIENKLEENKTPVQKSNNHNTVSICI